MANVVRDLSPRCYGGMCKLQRSGDELIELDPGAVRELFLNEIMSELNFEEEALQAKMHGEGEGHFRKKE